MSSACVEKNAENECLISGKVRETCNTVWKKNEMTTRNPRKQSIVHVVIKLNVFGEVIYYLPLKV